MALSTNIMRKMDLNELLADNFTCLVHNNQKSTPGLYLVRRIVARAELRFINKVRASSNYLS